MAENSITIWEFDIAPKNLPEISEHLTTSLRADCMEISHLLKGRLLFSDKFEPVCNASFKLAMELDAAANSISLAASPLPSAHTKAAKITILESPLSEVISDASLQNAVDKLDMHYRTIRQGGDTEGASTERSKALDAATLELQRAFGGAVGGLAVEFGEARLFAGALRSFAYAQRQFNA